MNHIRLIVLALFWGLTSTTHAQWSVDAPEAIRNSHYHLTQPTGSNYVYAFGDDMLTFDFTTQTLTAELDYRGTFPFQHTLTFAPSVSPFSAVQFTSEDTGFVASYQRIYKTVNRGRDWQVVEALSPNTSYPITTWFTDLHFPDAQTGYAVGTADKIFKTTDGGENWQVLQWSSNTAPYRHLSEVWFRNAQEGFIIGYEVADILLNIGEYKHFVMRTSDGGHTWQESFVLPVPGTSDHHYGKLVSVGDDHLFLTLINRNYVFPYDLLLHSDDNGETWRYLNPPRNGHKTSLIRDMHWFDEDEGILVGGTQGYLAERFAYRTTDRGQTWEEIALPVWPYETYLQPAAYALHFQGDQGLIVGAGGGVFHSIDRGQSWEALVAPFPTLRAIDMIDQQYGYAVGNSGLILKKDSGQWDTLSPPTASHGYIDGYEQVAFIDAQRGALLGETRDVYQTSDGGQTWQQVLSRGDTVILDMGYLGAELLVLAREENQRLMLLRKGHNATIWQAEAISPAGQLIPTHLEGRLNITANGEVFASFDGKLFQRQTNSWAIVAIPQNQSFSNKFFFADQQKGLLALSDSIWYTHDGGTTWIPAQPPSNLNAPNGYVLIGFDRLDTGKWVAMVWIYGSEGQYPQDAVFLSEDDGATWTTEAIGAHQESNLLGLSKHAWDVVEGHLYLGCTNGVVLHRAADDVTSAIQIPSDAAISVFPNPFVNVFQVRHNFPYVRLEIYDLNGRRLYHKDQVLSGGTIHADVPTGQVLLVRMQYQDQVQNVKLLQGKEY